ncbi:MAG: AsmA-like C-terminal region-containing protein [Candidatus Rifleibacteriota bacterium]
MNENIEATPQNPRKRGLGFYLKVILTFIILLAISAGIALYYVYNRLFNDERFEQIISARLSSATRMSVAFAGIDMAFPGFVVRDAMVATSTTDLQLDAKVSRIAIYPDFWAALGGQLLLDDLSVSSASVNLTLSGKLPASSSDAEVASAPAFDPAAIVFPFKSVSVESITLNYRESEKAAARTFILKKASLEKSMLSASLPFVVEAFSQQYANLKIDGSISWPNQVQAKIFLDSVNLAELKALVPAQYHSQFSLLNKPELKAEAVFDINSRSLKISSLSLTAEPEINVSGIADFSSTSPLAGKFSCSMKPVQAATLLKVAGNLVPPDLKLAAEKGGVATDLEIEFKPGAEPAIKASIKPSDLVFRSAALPESVHLQSGQIGFDGKALNFSALQAGFAEARITLTQGTAEISPPSFTGSFNLSLDFDKFWPIIAAYLPESAKRVTPTGKASFGGSAAYGKQKFALNGAFESSSIGLTESVTKAGAKLQSVKIKFSDLSPTGGSIDIESLKVSGAGGDLSVSGQIKNGKDPNFALKASGKINLTDFSGLAASVFKLPVKKEQFAGNLELDMSLGGSLENLQPKGSLSFTGVRADFSDRGMLIANLQGKATADVKKLEVKDLTADLAGGKLSLSGSLNDFKKPQVDAGADIAGADLSKVLNFIRLNFPEMPKELEFSGFSDLKIKLTGPIAQPKVEGGATLKKSRFSHPAVLRPIENINGPVSFDNAGLTTSGIEASWGSSTAVVTGSLKDWGKLVSNFSYEVKPLDATDAAGFFLKDTGYRFEGTGSGKGKISGELEKIKVSGQAQLPEGLFAAPISETNKEEFKFPFKNLVANFTYFDKLFTVESASLAIFSGKISASGTVDLNKDPIAFNFGTQHNQVETSEFLKENSKMSKALRGGLDGSAAISGNVTGLASLNGTANLMMKQGAYTSPPVVQKICEQLGAMHLASGTIENVSGDYTIASGRISSKNTMAKSKDGKMTYIGSVGLDTTLDGTMNLEINKAACAQSQILSQMVGDEEFLLVPISVKGSLTSPSVGIPLDNMLKDAAEKKIKKTVEKKATDALGKIFGINKDKPADQTATPTAQPETEKKPEAKIEKKIKDIGKDLKKIFKF